MNTRSASRVFPLQQLFGFICFSAQLAIVKLHAAEAMSFEVGEPGLELLRGPYLQSGTPHSVIARWRTSIPVDSRVSYGTNPNNLNRNIVYATQTTEHEVQLVGLLPDTKYFYAIGTASTTLARGPDYFFMTPPLHGKPTRIWVIGDSGTANDAARAVRDAYYAYTADRYTDLWLMLGDNAYGVGTDTEYQGAVFNMYPEILRQTILWPTLGNHDAYSAGSPGEFPYLDIFTLPTQGEAGGIPSGTEKYYSYNYGNIHFAVLDAMSSDRSSNATMCSWLRADLAAHTNDWLIAYWHHPPYTKGSHDSDTEIELIEMRENVVPILESYGVDLVLCGHSHSYERSYLLNGHYGNSGSLTPSMILDRSSGRPENGPYVKASTGPASHLGAVYAVAGSSGQVSGGFLDHPVMLTSLSELGSLVLDINGQSLEAKFLRENGEIDDHFTIVKSAAATGLRITAVSIAENSLTLTWNSSVQTNYRVQRTTNLQPAAWTTISPDIAGNPDTTSWAHSLAGAPVNAFYRVFSFPD